MPDINDNRIENELRSIIAEILEIDQGEVILDANFVEDLGMDSMMALEILASVEKKYKLRIPEENLTKLTSLRKAVELVSKYINK